MKRIIIIALCLLLAAFPALGEVDMEALADYLRGKLLDGTELVSVELDERVLSVVAALGYDKELYSDYLTFLAGRAADVITDGILSRAELEGEWDLIFLDITDVGYYFFTPDDIWTDEQGVRHVPLFDDDGNSLIATDTAPVLPADQQLEVTVRQYLENELGWSELDYITINPDYGTADPEDYIVLIHIVFTGGEENRALIQPLSDSLATYLSENYPDVQELCIFWERPSDKSVAEKRAYERKGGALSPTDVMQAQKFD